MTKTESSWLKTIWPVVAATTYHSYQKLTNEICAYFEPLNLHLSEVTHSQIQDYYSWLFNRGLSSNSVLHYHAILHKAFSDAVKAGYITSSPMLCYNMLDPKSSMLKNVLFSGSYQSYNERVIGLSKHCLS